MQTVPQHIYQNWAPERTKQLGARSINALARPVHFQATIQDYPGIIEMTMSPISTGCLIEEV